jgi:hypothetical protein
MIIIINYDFISYNIIKKIINYFYAFFTKKKKINDANCFLNFKVQLPLQRCLKTEC